LLHIEDDNTLTKHLLHLKGGGASGAYGMLVEAANGNDLFVVDTLTYKVTMPSGYPVGIGNAAPQHLLHVGAVLGTALNNAGSLLRNSNTTYTAIVGGSHNSTTYNETAVALKIFTHGGTRGAGKYGGGISFEHLAPNDYPTYDHGSHAAIALRYTDVAGAEKSALTFLTTNTTGAGDQPVEKMCVMPDGKVGIGTTAPSAVLTTRGSSGILFNVLQGTTTRFSYDVAAGFP